MMRGGGSSYFCLGWFVGGSWCLAYKFFFSFLIFVVCERRTYDCVS